MQTHGNTTQAYQDFTAGPRRLAGIMLPTVGLFIVLWMMHAPGRTLYLLALTLPVALWAAALCLWYVRNYRLRLYEDRLEVITLDGKVRRTILSLHVTAWAHPGNTGIEPNAFTRFIMFTPLGNYSIRTAYYKDISLLIETVQQGRKEDPRPKQRYERRAKISALAMLALLIVMPILSYYVSGNMAGFMLPCMVGGLLLFGRIMTVLQERQDRRLAAQRRKAEAELAAYEARLPATFIEDAHQASYNNESSIMGSEVCGCFNCLQTFEPTDITYWLDEEEGCKNSAVCPYCDSISVIGSATGCPVTNSMYLQVLRNHWSEIFEHREVELFYTDDYLSDATDACMHNKSTVLASKTCGCFYCLETYLPARIQEWTNKQHWSEPSAVCPYCGTGTVIGSASGYPVADPVFLRALYNKWFD